MHSFLKAIGFSNLEGCTDEEALIRLVMENAEQRQVARISDKRSAVELYMEVADNVGITLCGEYDEQGSFHPEYYFPMLKGQNVSMTEAVHLNQRVDNSAITGMSDDYRIGVSMIFYLQNKMELLGRDIKKRDKNKYPVMLTALAGEGKVLLPVQKNKTEEEQGGDEIKNRSALIAEAKKGNRDAIESLTMDDIDLYALVNRRIRKEDIYSIVETTFIPYGTESDNYTVLGYITGIKECVNSYTKESLYLLSLVCNELPFEVCINKKDLEGEPVLGRRFRGNVWMQGKMEV